MSYTYKADEQSEYPFDINTLLSKVRHSGDVKLEPLHALILKKIQF